MAEEAFAPDQPGSIVGGFMLVRRLDRHVAGLSEVWLARRVGPTAIPSPEYVAIKLLGSIGSSADAEIRLVAEARLLEQWNHDHIVRVYGHGLDPRQHRPFFVMEYVATGSGDSSFLSLERPRAARTTPEDLATRLRVLRQLAAAVAFAHERGVAHGDIKPENCLLGEELSARLIDFGEARSLFGDTTIGDRFALTEQYAAPERLAGGPVTEATDQFSLAVTAYYILTGELPDDASLRHGFSPAHVVAPVQGG